MRRMGLVLVVGLVGLTASCGLFTANPKGGSHQLGNQDVIGSAFAGQCVAVLDYTVASQGSVKYCGPYAKQWCTDHPGTEPTDGTCDGVPGWVVYDPSNGAATTTSGEPPVIHSTTTTHPYVRPYTPPTTAPTTTTTTEQGCCGGGATTSTTGQTHYGGGNGYVP